MSSGSRRKRKRRRKGGGTRRPPAESGPDRSSLERGYARARAKDDEARARLVPLRAGERPTAVTIGAVVALVGALAQLVVVVVSYDPHEPNKIVLTAAGVAILLVVAVGMWRARYWGVLGMQTLLALTIVASALGLIGVGDVLRALVLVVILLGAGILFWFLVKAMARIQMPERPGSRR